MLCDRRDFGLMRLAGAYQWPPLTPLRTIAPLKRLRQEVEVLSTLGLLTFSRSGKYLMLSPEGYQALPKFGLHYQPPAKRSDSNNFLQIPAAGSQNKTRDGRKLRPSLVEI